MHSMIKLCSVLTGSFLILSTAPTFLPYFCCNPGIACFLQCISQLLPRCTDILLQPHMYCGHQSMDLSARQIAGVRHVYSLQSCRGQAQTRSQHLPVTFVKVLLNEDGMNAVHCQLIYNQHITQLKHRSHTFSAPYSEIQTCY